MKIQNKIFIIWALFFLWISTARAWFVYPFKEISKSDCRFQSFDTLTSDCKKDLPILHTADYKKLKDDYNYRRVYTVLWWATYDYGWDTWYGSHQWVDIATSEGTPIYAIWDGTVRIAWEMTGRWKTIVIEHTVNGRKIYSNYAHLSKIWVVSWQKLKAWDLIWRVGHTGNSYGNHLHFQIDLDTSSIHPYYPTKLTCGDPLWDSMALVNKWYCRSDLLAKTVDPLAFLETQWAIVSAKKTEEQILQDNKKQVEQTKISAKTILSRADIQKMEVENFLKNYSLTFTLNKSYTNLQVWDSLKLTIILKDRLGKPFNWVTPDYINFSYDKKILSVFPEKVLILENWQRDIVINAIKKWATSLDIKIWATSIKKLDFFTYTKWEVIYGDKAWIWWDKWVAIWDKTSSKVVIYKWNYKLIWVPYSGKYILKSKNNNVLFCLKNPQTESQISSVMASKCAASEYKDSIIFGINDTLAGTLYYDYKVIWSDKSYIVNVLNWKTNAILGEKKLEITYAKDVSSSLYAREVQRFLEAWIIENISKNYFWPDMSLNQQAAKTFLINTLTYMISKEKNKENLAKLKTNLRLLQSLNLDKSKNITRKQFFDLIYKFMIINKNDSEKIKYLDLTADYRAKVWNLFDENNTWRDKFWARYFQPDKEITRWEAVYMISKIK